MKVGSSQPIPARSTALVASLSRTMLALTAELFGSDRLRREAAWVVGHKVVEFLLVFVGLKLLTSLMTPAAFGEYNLALTAVGLLTDVAAMPIAHAYYRSLSAAQARGAARSLNLSFLRWYASVTLILALVVAVSTRQLSTYLGIGAWTALATAFLFLTNRWRALGVELADLQRDRRGSAFQNLGFIALQTVLVACAAYAWRDSTATALGAYAAAAAMLAIIGTAPMVRHMLLIPTGEASQLRRTIVTFGIPYGLLLMCQWVQSFSERYILGIQLDLNSVGAYVATYQVCGIPYMLFSAIFNGLAVPIAYQRAGDGSEPSRLWAADRVLLASACAYLAFGLAALPIYWLWGEKLMRLLTNVDFVLPQGIVLCLAGARFMQCLGLLLQSFFAVHQRMGVTLAFRVVGGLIVVPVCWFAIRSYGVAGAAVGVLVGGILYTILVCAGPGGCLALIQTTRRASRLATLTNEDGAR